MFDQKTDRHDHDAMSAPAMIGPSAAPPIAPATHHPNAIDNARPENVERSAAIVAGTISAAPTPSTTRTAISCSVDCESAEPAEPATKRASPSTRIRRRPKRSASAPPLTNSTATGRRYAL